jgi:predicted urease superfamily metal-dependent hydrolase
VSYLDRLFLGRGFGHTHTMMEGAGNADCVVIVAHKQEADRMRAKWPRPQYLTIDQLDRLNGLRKPQVLDHYAMHLLAQKDRGFARRSGIEAAIGKVREMRSQTLAVQPTGPGRTLGLITLDDVINELTRMRDER